MSDTGDRALDAQRELDLEREHRDPDRSPEWHLAEAEEHLLEADVLAAAGALGEATARLLAATANAQIGALKLALRQEHLLERVTDDLRTLLLNTEETAINTRKPR